LCSAPPPPIISIKESPTAPAIKDFVTMAVLRQIAQLGNPILRAPAAPVPFPLTDDLATLIDDMLETLRDADGVGLAAPQVHQPLQIMIVASRPNPRYPEAVEMEPLVVVNPEIVERSGERVKGWEGCLSIPGLRGEVSRHKRVTARYQDVDGEPVVREFHDFIARIFQHEDDHLRGIVFLDRLEDGGRLATEREYQKRFARG
jgi:peptide deformylase